MALITRAALKQGQFGAFSAMMGINLASVIWTILAAMGFVVLMRTIPHADSFLLVVGGLFMGYIGIKDLKSGFAMKNAGAGQQKKEVSAESNGELFRKGFIVNATNPKIGLYYATVLPNFLTSNENQEFFILGMGLAHNILGFCWFMTFAYFLVRGLKLFGTASARSNITIITGIALMIFSFTALYYVGHDLVFS
jgi:threonine/homoserine/homoserine lactone efflux protein